MAISLAWARATLLSTKAGEMRWARSALLAMGVRMDCRLGFTIMPTVASAARA